MKDMGGPKPKPKVSSGLGSLASLTKVKSEYNFESIPVYIVKKKH